MYVWVGVGVGVYALLCLDWYLLHYEYLVPLSALSSASWWIWNSCCCFFFAYSHETQNRLSLPGTGLLISTFLYLAYIVKQQAAE